jgi:hypothetical protein
MRKIITQLTTICAALLCHYSCAYSQVTSVRIECTSTGSAWVDYDDGALYKPDPPKTYHYIFDLQSNGIAARTVLSNNPPANFLWLRENNTLKIVPPETRSRSTNLQTVDMSTGRYTWYTRDYIGRGWLTSFAEGSCLKLSPTQ